MEHEYFGRRMKGNKIPCNFPLYQITVPTSIHYTTVDELADPIDVKNLISQLNSTKCLYVQTIDSGEFNHIDFAWGIHAADIVYSEIIKFFANFQ